MIELSSVLRVEDALVNQGASSLFPWSIVYRSGTRREESNYGSMKYPWDRRKGTCGQEWMGFRHIWHSRGIFLPIFLKLASQNFPQMFIVTTQKDSNREQIFDNSSSNSWTPEFHYFESAKLFYFLSLHLAGVCCCWTKVLSPSMFSVWWHFVLKLRRK